MFAETKNELPLSGSPLRAGLNDDVYNSAVRSIASLDPSRYNPVSGYISGQNNISPGLPGLGSSLNPSYGSGTMGRPQQRPGKPPSALEKVASGVLSGAMGMGPASIMGGIAGKVVNGIATGNLENVKLSLSDFGMLGSFLKAMEGLNHSQIAAAMPEGLVDPVTGTRFGKGLFGETVAVGTSAPMGFKGWRERLGRARAEANPGQGRDPSENYRSDIDPDTGTDRNYGPGGVDTAGDI